MDQARNDYLTTEVMTAAPQKLQLMLVEAAIRTAQQALAHWEAGRDEQACEALVKCQQVVTELFAGLDVQAKSPLVRRVAGIYLFVYRSLVAANLEHSREKLQDALRVLEAERTTWQQVCVQLGTRKQDADVTAGASFEA